MAEILYTKWCRQLTMRPTSVNAGGDKALIKEQSITLDGSINGSGNIDFSWLPSPSLNDFHLLDPVVTPVVSTDYVLTASSGTECGTSSDTALVKV